MARFLVVVVGSGAIAGSWLPVLAGRADCEVRAVVEVDPGRARETISRYGLSCGVYSELGAAIDRTGANLVADLTPPQSRGVIVREALARGCDVISEKPMAQSLGEARVLVAAARQAGKTFAVMQNRRFAPGIRALREGMAAGLIGKPTFVCADRFTAARHNGGFREQAMQDPLLLDMAVHTFDQARFLLSADPCSVYCHEFNPHGSWYAGNAAATCTFEFPDGAVFSYRGSCVAAGFGTPLDAVWRVAGSAGTALWDGEHDPVGEAAVPDRPGQVRAIRWPAAAGPLDQTHHAEAIDATLTALRNGRQPETACTDNLISLAMVSGAIKSAREGRRVQLGELLDEPAA